MSFNLTLQVIINTYISIVSKQTYHQHFQHFLLFIYTKYSQSKYKENKKKLANTRVYIRASP